MTQHWFTSWVDCTELTFTTCFSSQKESILDRVQHWEKYRQTHKVGASNHSGQVKSEKYWIKKHPEFISDYLYKLMDTARYVSDVYRLRLPLNQAF